MRVTKPYRVAVAVGILGILSVWATAPQAESWPQRPVKFIIPFGPGAGADIGARLFQEALQVRWGKPVVIENRPGRRSIVAIQTFLSANDDHTFLWSPSGNFTVHRPSTRNCLTTGPYRADVRYPTPSLRWASRR